MAVAGTLLRLAGPPALSEPPWTVGVFTEVTHGLAARFGKTPENARYREAAMQEFFPDAPVANYEPFAEKLTNSLEDRHLLAAPVASRADHLVTFNLKHFPSPAVHRSTP